VASDTRSWQVLFQTADERWHQLFFKTPDGESGDFEGFEEASSAATRVAGSDKVKRVLVYERRPVMDLNGGAPPPPSRVRKTGGRLSNDAESS